MDTLDSIMGQPLSTLLPEEFPTQQQQTRRQQQQLLLLWVLNVKDTKWRKHRPAAEGDEEQQETSTNNVAGMW